MPGKWVKLFASIVAAVAILALAMKFFPERQFIVLPDGTKLRLEGVSLGNDSFQYGNSGFDLRRFNLFRPFYFGFFTNPDEEYLLVWLSGSTNGFTYSHLGRLKNLRTIAVGNNGTEYENIGGQAYNVHGPSPDLIALKLASFPRDQDQFNLYLSVKDASEVWRKSGAITVKNLLPTRPTEWKETQLPITNQVGETEFVLHRVESGVGILRNEPLQYAAQIRVSRRYKAGESPDWQIEKGVSIDPLNNSGYFYKQSGRRREGFHLEQFVTECALNPSAIWRIVLSLKSSDPAQDVVDTAEFKYSGTEQRMEQNSKTLAIPVIIEVNGSKLEVKLREAPKELEISRIYVQDPVRGEIPVSPLTRREHKATFSRTVSTNSKVKVELQKRVKLEYFVRPTIVEKGTTNSFFGQ